MKVQPLGLWVEEDHGGVYKTRFKVKETLFTGKSDFQRVDIVETEGHGRMLFNDGLAMVSERDEFVYHDMIAHVPLFVHPNPRRVLVIGGGDGGTAREVIRHPEVEKCDMVEIDKMVVDACREHIPQTASMLDNEKINLMFADGVKYVAEIDTKYDVILVDSTDPIGPAKPLFGPQFYQNVYDCLSEDGVVVSQGESPFFYVEMQQSLLKTIGQIFPIAMVYNFANMTYPGGLWSFTFASKGLHPLRDIQEERVASSSLDFNYYNKEIHKGSFALPSFQLKNLAGLIKE